MRGKTRSGREFCAYDDVYVTRFDNITLGVNLVPNHPIHAYEDYVFGPEEDINNGIFTYLEFLILILDLMYYPRS